MMREATVDTKDGVSVGEHITNALRHADNKAVVSNSQQGLLRLMNNINDVTKEFRMEN